MLQFILGKSGTGKTTCIYEKISELVKNGNDKIIMLVPDMSTFETEKALLNLLGAHLSKNIKVFGFTRICRYVFDKTLCPTKNVIDSGTRGVIMNIAIEQLTDKLKLLKTKNTKSLTDTMLQTLSDCKKNSVSTKNMYEVSKNVKNETLKSKLYETALILDTYDAILSQSYVDPLDDLTRLYNILCENNIFDGYCVFIDSFSGFSAQQLKVLRLIISQSSKTFVALTLDPESDGREDVFATSNATYKTLKKIAKADFIDIKAPLKLTENKKFSNNELDLLEKSVFRNDYVSSDENPENIILYSASDRYEECEFVARRIKQLVIEENMLYSNISVICHDTQPYKGIINAVFEKYEIPYFMDSQSDIEVKPVVRMINSIFRIILDNFERDDVISLIKTGLTGIEPDDISAFENYVYIWNINNSAFKSEFTQNPRGFTSNYTEQDKKTLKVIENVRKTIIDPILDFKTSIKNKTVREITQLLYELLTKLNVQDSLNKMYDTFENSCEKGLGTEQIRVWNFLMQALDKTVAVIGDTYVTDKRYYELLSIQISSIELSQIPQTLDSVTITTAQRVRISKQKVSFLIGCVDGEFPAVPHCSGVFSSFELKMLSINDLKLSDDFSEVVNLETFMAYSCITSPSDKLFVSYPSTDLLGTVSNPSVIFEEIRKVFPNIIMLDKSDFNRKRDSMYALEPAFEEYARSLSKNSAVLESLGEFFSTDSKYSAKTNAVLRSIDGTPFRIENHKNAEKLFGENLRISASQIEKFNKCKFAYFCNYGLKVRERLKAEINPLEYGTLVHFILEEFFTKYKKDEYSLIDDDKLQSFIGNVISEYLQQHFGGAENRTKAFLYSVKVLSDNAFILLKHIIAELKQSDFEVSDCELKIGEDIPEYTIKIPGGHNIAVCGSVDRVDVMEKDGQKYLRIIDYKTGPKKFKLSDILYGLNLQMLIYLYSIKLNGTNKYGEITPAGILYVPATVPPLTSDEILSEDRISNKLDQNLKMNGLLLDDVSVIKGMDKSEKARYIPVKIKLDATVSNESTASLEEFGKIFKKLESTVASMGKSLYSGEIEAAPAKGADDACKYCPYDSVCAYRLSEPKYVYSLDNEEVFKLLDKESNSGGDL